MRAAASVAAARSLGPRRIIQTTWRSCATSSWALKGRGINIISFYVTAVVKPPCVCFFLHSGHTVAPGHDCSGAFLWYGNPASRTTGSPCGLSHPATISRSYRNLHFVAGLKSPWLKGERGGERASVQADEGVD